MIRDQTISTTPVPEAYSSPTVGEQQTLDR